MSIEERIENLEKVAGTFAKELARVITRLDAIPPVASCPETPPAKSPWDQMAEEILNGKPLRATILGADQTNYWIKASDLSAALSRAAEVRTREIVEWLERGACVTAANAIKAQFLPTERQP